MVVCKHRVSQLYSCQKFNIVKVGHTAAAHLTAALRAGRERHCPAGIKFCEFWAGKQHANLADWLHIATGGTLQEDTAQRPQQHH